MIWYEKDLEIRYADTDKMGVVHHAVYPLYCEIGRTHTCAALGMPYHELENEDIYFMVADMYCRFKEPIRYGDSVYVRTALATLKKRLLAFRYEIRQRSSNTLLFTGTTKHIVSRRTHGAMSLPKEYLEKFSKGLA